MFLQVKPDDSTDAVADEWRNANELIGITSINKNGYRQ